MHLFPHRCSRRDERGVVVPSRLMIVAIVVVAIGAAMYVATTPSKKTAAAADTTSAARIASSTPSPSSARSSSSASATPSKRASASSTPSSSPTSASTPKASSSPSASVSAPSRAVRRAATFVEVFNNTKRKGLAGRAATRAKSVGWKVVGSDNWYGTIPTSTVYYPKAMARAAKVLARDLGISRVEPAVSPMRGDRLTVILTSGYRLQ
ncbi:LytR family transcriptional regulator [Nocardioides mangrovicus]|uniref:LytR family transcriptional regulator n=1 Tax=Nocardioides mangrovicus TaxID=2478913 RepID=A0A3L8NXK9_9ACTN|nr:LytR C-terminal domain-containing protein [Nocardioides mangrovicus]RLV47571.1 LytR family transcriptional regulator [Nocardioides mangrovicus]